MLKFFKGEERRGKESDKKGEVFLYF